MQLGDLGLFLLVMAALAIGYVLGRYDLFSSGRTIRKITGRAASQYLRGLNFILNDNPEAAVDTFAQVLEVNQESFETYLSLGILLRSRGEIGHAIKFHQNLLENHSLSEHQKYLVRLELGLDFQKAGVFDQAERIFEGLRQCEIPSIKTKSLEYLADIFRDERDWPKAIATSDELIKLAQDDANRSKWLHRQAHFYCELALEAKNFESTERVEQILNRARASDPQCPRVSLEWAKLKMELGDYAEAIKQFQKVPNQDPDFIPEILPELLECFRALGNPYELIDYLRFLQDRYPSSSLLISLAEQVKRFSGETAAVELLDQKLKTRPSLRVIGKFLDFQFSRKEKNNENQRAQQLVRELLELLVIHRSYYLCGSCGFSGNHLHWLCPSCKSWGTTKAVKGIEGE
ncbi:lipopolysaccharide assembly protein LapB [Sessilibacter sp. MAH1]